MNPGALWVFDGLSPVGVIRHDAREDAWTFAYDPAWRQTASAYPLSPHFPLSGPNPASATVRRFIANLLPEGRALDDAATLHQVSKTNLFALIRELGADTAGALTFLPEGAEPAAQPTRKREIPRVELARRIEDRGQSSLSIWDGRMRMSLAGYQDKIAVYCEEDRFYLVEGALSSTHILKPEPGERLPFLAANEHFCMRLAQRVGLPTAPVDLLRLPHPVLRVERFDRQRRAGGVRRLPMIDACQALDLPVVCKYERNFGAGRDVRHIRDGVSFPRLLGTQRAMAQPALAAQALTRWALFQYLIGNSDAHGKNVSFFCRPEGLTLAPFYDLVSVVQYPDIDHELAMAYGDEFNLDQVKPYDWAQFAHDCGINRPYLAREMIRLSKAVQREAPLEAASGAYLGAERDFVQGLLTLTTTQADRLTDMVRDLRTIDAAALL